MTRLALVVAAALCASNVDAQGYRSVKVRSCPYADSLIGPLRDDHRADVMGLYHEERDSTYLLAGTGGSKPSRLNISIKLAGQRPTRDPAAQLIVFLRGGDARAMSASTDSLVVTLALNESTTVRPAAAALGRFEGPTKVPVVIPVSALLLSDDLLSMTQAQKIAVTTGPVTMVLSNDERRSVRAVLRVALCPP